MSSRIQALRSPPDEKLVDRLENLIREVAIRVDEGEECGALIEQINQLSGGIIYEPHFFFELYGWTDERSVAEIAAKGLPPTMDDLTREELVEVLKIIESGGEPDTTFFLSFLDRCYPNSFSSDLIYYPHRQLTNEETVDELMLREELFRTGGKLAIHNREVELARAVMADPDSPVWAREGAKGILKSDS